MLGWSFSVTLLGIEEACLKPDVFVEEQRLTFKHS